MDCNSAAAVFSGMACARARHALADAEAALTLARWTGQDSWKRIADDRLDFAMLHVEFAERLLGHHSTKVGLFAS